MSAADLETIPFTAPDGRPCYCPTASYADPTRMVTCKRRYCPRCGQRWAWDWRRVLAENLRAYAGPVMVIAITPPGSEVLPWGCTRDHEHNGAKYGCQVDAAAATTWAEEARGNWAKLRQAARVATHRALGGLKPTLLGRVWEPQKRGVPHLHIVLGMKTADEKAAAHRFVDELERLAPDYLFGFVQGERKETGYEEASRYLTGYLLGRSKRKSTIRENIADPRMPRSLVWLTPALTSTSHAERIKTMRERIGIRLGTGVTMRTLRVARWVVARIRGYCDVSPTLKGILAVDAARSCVAIDRVKILRAPRGPDEDDGAVEERAFQDFFRVIRAMRGDEHASKSIVRHGIGLARAA